MNEQVKELVLTALKRAEAAVDWEEIDLHDEPDNRTGALLARAISLLSA